MKKLFVLISCFAVVLVMSKTSFAQESVAPLPNVSELSLEDIIGEARTPMVPQAVPFGSPPYPMVDGYPAYGIPYSYPRGAMRAARQAQRPRRFAGRLAPPPYQPYALPAPGILPGMVPPPVAPPPVVAPGVFGEIPCQETLGAVPAVPAPLGPPNVYYRPTPIKNFMTLMTAPRPYIGYDPYAGYPPFPGYVPPQ